MAEQRTEKVVKTILSVKSLAAGASTELKDCTLLDLEHVKYLALTAICKYASGATKPIAVHVRSSHNGGEWDTTDYTVFENDLQAGATGQRTVVITPDVRYLKVIVENQDTAEAVTNVKIVATITKES